MIDILLSLQKYVLRLPATTDIPSPGGTTVCEVDNSEVRKILFGKCYYINPAYIMQNVIGGDQLTASRIRGSKRVRKKSYSTLQHLQAFIPCVKDWHARVCLLGVRNAVLACTPFHYQASGATATSSSLLYFDLCQLYVDHTEPAPSP